MCIYFSKYNVTFNLYVHMTMYYSLLEYNESMFLTDCKHPLTILDMVEYLNFKNFYNCCYVHPVNSMGSCNI